MIRVKYAVLKMVAVVAVVMLFCGSNAMAAGTAWFGTASSSGSIGNSGGNGGGGCNADSNTYRIDCAGVSWIYYESLKETDTDTIMVPHTKVFGSGETAYISSQCSKHGSEGGFWHFGRNAQGLSRYGQNYFETVNYVNGYDNASVFTYSTSAGSWGHAATVGYGLYSGPRYVIPYKTQLPLNNVIYENGEPLYRAVKYGTPSEVLKDYQKVYANEYPEAPLQTSLPDDLYAFCSWNLSEPEFYSSSNARAGEDNSHLAMTGIKKVETRKDASRKKVKVGDVLPIVFSHNIYATEKAKSVNWNMDRWVEVKGEVKNGFFWDGYYGKYEMSNYTEGDYQGTTDVEENLVPQSGNVKYVAKASGYITRDNYQSVKFKEEGVYTFCETMNVKGKKLTTACVEIEVTKDPDEPGPGSGPDPQDYCAAWSPSEYLSSNENEGFTRTISAVKNNDAGFNNWAVSNGNSEEGFYKNAVYAKPDDNVEWKHCYYPGVQKTADRDITTWYTTCSFRQTTEKLSRLIAWENKFDIKQKNMDNFSTSESFSIGDSNTKGFDNSYSIETGNRSRAGLTLTESMISGTPQWARVNRHDGHSCCCDCSCDEPPCGGCCCSESYTTYSHNADGTVYSDTAMVKVPYNFENKITVSLNNPNSIVYAGETANVQSANVSVNTRENNTTKGRYATRVNESEVRLIAYSSYDSGGEASIQAGYSADICSTLSITHDNCNIIDYAGEGLSGVLNRNENYENGSTDKRFNQQRYNVYDVPAGEYYCVVAAVYPYIVSGDTDVDGVNGHAPWVNDKNSYSWYVSAPSCNQVAKKPSLQVWGNSLYTSGNIVTSVSEKRVVWGYYGFQGSPYGQSAANTTVFGSWVEQSILAPTASIAGLASGASTAGYTSNPSLFGNRSKNGLGGSYEGGFVAGGSKADFCIRSPLTMPNAGCGLTEITGGYGSVSVSKPSDKSALIARFTGSDRREFEYDNARREFGETVIEKGRTLVIDIDDTFTIKGNIVYEDNYSTTEEIPKLIIYADRINIECGVTRVDAVLIAEQAVDTCSNGGDINSEARSMALKINGTVITDKLVAGRTFGAGVGAASAEPAEVIDYDTSLYLWGVKRANSAFSGKIPITYQHELSPRY